MLRDLHELFLMSDFDHRDPARFGECPVQLSLHLKRGSLTVAWLPQNVQFPGCTPIYVANKDTPIEMSRTIRPLSSIEFEHIGSSILDLPWPPARPGQGGYIEATLQKCDYVYDVLPTDALMYEASNDRIGLYSIYRNRALSKPPTQCSETTRRDAKRVDAIIDSLHLSFPPYIVRREPYPSRIGA